MKTVETTVQLDEKTLNQFEEFCVDTGLNISTAFNIFMYAVLRERKIPFEIIAENKLSPDRQAAIENLYALRAEAEKRGFLSDEEIEFEIQEAKKEIRKREKELREKEMAEKVSLV